MNDEYYNKIAKCMLYAPVLNWGEYEGKPMYGTLDEYIGVLDVEDAERLGVYLSEGKYHWYSDIRGDQIEEGKVCILAKALKYALENCKI